MEDEADFVEGEADDINEVGDRQHDFEAEFAATEDAGDFAVAVVGSAIDVVGDQHGAAAFQPPHGPRVRQLTLVLGQAVGNDVDLAFRVRDFVGGGKAAAPAGALRLPFLLAAGVLTFLFGSYVT